MQIPPKLQAGQNFKQATVRTVNNILQYLKTQRLVSDNKTIKVNQLSSGISLSVIKDGATGRGGKKNVIRHPFKLKIVQDQATQQDQVAVQMGCIYFQGSDYSTYDWICYDEDYAFDDSTPFYIPMQWGDLEDGFYEIYAYSANVVTDAGDIGSQAGCLVVQNEQIPCCAGFWTVKLGTINKETTDDEGYALSVWEQCILGDIILDDSHVTQPWAINFLINFGEEGSLKTAEEFKIDLVKVHDGTIYTGGNAIFIEDDAEFVPPDYGEFYCYYSDGKIKWTADVDKLKLSSSCFVLCGFLYEEAYIYTEQFIRGDLILSGAKDHPFRLYIQEEGEGDALTPVLKMIGGDVRLQSNSTQIVRFESDLVNFDCSSLSQGFYGVIGVVQHLKDETISGKVLLISSALSTYEIPAVCGYEPFPIGVIKVIQQTDAEENVIKSVFVDFQYLYSNFYLNDKEDLPFTAKVFIDHGAEDQIKTTGEDFKITGYKVNYGNVYDLDVPDSSFVGQMHKTVKDENNFCPTGKGLTFAYLQRTKNADGLHDYAIKWGTSEQMQPLFEFDGAQIVKEKYILADVFNDVFIYSSNYHPCDFIFQKSDTYKVKTNDGSGSLANDKKPDFLINKLYSDARQLGSQGAPWARDSSGGKLKGYVHIALEDIGEDTGSQLWFRWDYPSISGYGDKYLTLNCKSGDPAWESMGMIRLNQGESAGAFLPAKVTAKNPLSIKETGGKLEWSINLDDYVKSVVGANCITTSETNNNGKVVTVQADIDCIFSNLSITGTAPIIVTGSGKNWNISIRDNAFIKDVQGANCVNVTVANGVATVQADIDCIFSNLSITGTDPIIVTGSGKDWDVSIRDDAFIKDVQGANCVNVTVANGVATVQADIDCIFQNLSITGTDPIIVTGSGKDWNISINEDALLNHLLENLSSSKNHITIQQSSNGEKMIADLNINPQAFISSDQSLTIEATNDDKIDFRSCCKVKVNEHDDPDYLEAKIDSANASLIIMVTSGMGYGLDLSVNPTFFKSEDESILIKSLGSGEVAQGIDFKINPEIFTSSDNTVTITATEDGKIDFTEAGGLVMVNEGDLPNYLIEKLSSSKNHLTITESSDGQQMTADFNLNSQAFTSSDNTVTITATEDGKIDFTEAGGLVMVNEGDLPNYLIEKLSSSKNHLTITESSDGQQMTADFNLNSQAFISSDESIKIEVTQDGKFDFRGQGGKVKVSENDEEADYLGVKLVVDASISGLITLEDQGSQLAIKSALTGSGILIIENGAVKTLEAPAYNAVLTCQNGSFAWVEYKDCENACS